MSELRNLPLDPGLYEDIPGSRGGGDPMLAGGLLQDAQPTPNRVPAAQVPDAPPSPDENGDVLLTFQDREGRVRTINTTQVDRNHSIWEELKAARQNADATNKALAEEAINRKVDEALDPVNLGRVVEGWLGEGLQESVPSEWHPPRALEVEPEEAKRLSGQLLEELNNDQTQFRVYAADKRTGERQTAAAIVREGAALDVRTPEIQRGFAGGDVILLVFKLVDGTALKYAYNGQTYVEVGNRDGSQTLDYRGRPTTFRIGARQQLGEWGDKMYSTELSEIILPDSMLKGLPGYSEPSADNPRVSRTAEPNPFADAATLVRMAEEFSNKTS